MNRLKVLLAGCALLVTFACAASDPGITTAVKSKLTVDDTVKAYQIDVDTQQHVVTLTGNVDTSVAKDRAVMIARETKGVNDVVDHLQVRDTAATSGFDIDSQVDNELKREADRAGDATQNAAEKTGDAVKKGANAVKEGAEKLGTKVRDAVTDRDRDSDNDGH